PDRCDDDQLPSTFTPLPRQPLDAAHRGVLSVLDMPAGAKRSAAATRILPVMNGVLERAIQRHGTNSPEAALALFDHASLTNLSTDDVDVSAARRTALRNNAETEQRNAIK